MGLLIDEKDINEIKAKKTGELRKDLAFYKKKCDDKSEQQTYQLFCTEMYHEVWNELHKRQDEFRDKKEIRRKKQLAEAEEFVKKYPEDNYGMDFPNLEEKMETIINEKCDLPQEEKDDFFSDLVHEVDTEMNETLPFTNYQYDKIEDQFRDIEEKINRKELSNEDIKYENIYKKKLININIPEHPASYFNEKFFTEDIFKEFEEKKCRVNKQDMNELVKIAKKSIYKKSDHPYIKWIKKYKQQKSE